MQPLFQFLNQYLVFHGHMSGQHDDPFLEQFKNWFVRVHGQQATLIKRDMPLISAELPDPMALFFSKVTMN